MAFRVTPETQEEPARFCKGTSRFNYQELLHPDLYGSLPSASRPELPVLEPIETESIAPIRLVPFHEASDVEETLFHDFAVQGYDLTFIYKGERYYFLSDKDHVALCDEHYTEEYQVFPDGNTALEQFKIDGKSLLELIDQLEEVEPV